MYCTSFGTGLKLFFMLPLAAMSRRENNLKKKNGIWNMEIWKERKVYHICNIGLGEIGGQSFEKGFICTFKVMKSRH